MFPVQRDPNERCLRVFLLLISPQVQPTWFFAFPGADLNLSAFPIGRNGKTRAFLKEKADTFPTNHVRSSEVIENDGRPVGTRTPDLYGVKARIGITITYKTAGTAKVRGSHTRHTFCGLGCGLEIREQIERLIDAERRFSSRTHSRMSAA